MNSKSNIKTNSPEYKEVSNFVILLMTGILAIIYFAFSTFSDGFYQHDEVGNFMLFQSFWYDDILQTLGANAKSGYKILYAIPALGGFIFLKLFNSVVAAFTVYFSYRLLSKLGSENKLLIFFVLGIQPLWFMLSFRNYSELTVAFLMVLAALQFFNKKYMITALIVSYMAFTRQEYHLISGLLFLVLLFKKEWIAALLTGFFTVFQNTIGWIVTGDVLYLPHSMIAYSEGIKNAWPKQGFEHYFLMSNVIFGAVALTLFVSYVAIIILKKKKPNWYILLPVLVIFLLNCAMNAQSFNFGPGNGGNLRYLIIISPLLGILGVLGLDEIIQFNKKYLLLIFLIPLLIAVGAFQTFDHNFIKLIEVVNWKPLIFSIIITVLLILPLKKQHYLISFALISIFLGISTITTRRIQPEEKTIQKAAKWYAQHLKLGNNPQTATTQLFTDTNRIACGHGLFFYYLEKNRRDFIKEPVMKLGIPKETADTFQVGDLIIWESHYGYRPKLSPTSQPYDFYDKNPNFEKIQYYQSIDKRFLVAFFRKIKN